MAAVTGLTLVKSFSYRDTAGEEFSNTYHFKSLPPGDDASWQVVMNDMVVQERTLFPASVSYARAYGYNSDDPHAAAVFQHDFTLSPPAPIGSLPTGVGYAMAGDQAACVQWKLDIKNTRGKWIYLRKYYHAGLISNGDKDKLETTYESTLQGFAALMAGTTVHGGLRPQRVDANITAQGPIIWVTTRTLKRRGKRPRTAS